MSPPDDYTAVVDYIRALALKEISDHTVVGMSMALVDDQQVIWSEGFDADKAQMISASTETLYWVGSVTKRVNEDNEDKGVPHE